MADARHITGRFLAQLLAFGLILAWAVYLFGWVWPYNLQARGETALAVQFASFFIRTFTFHLGISVAAVTILLALLRRWWWVLAGVALVLVCTVPTIARLFPPGPEPHRPETLRVLTANLRFINPVPEQALAAIMATDADVLFLQEYTPTMHKQFLPALRERYPHMMVEPRPTPYGEAVFSRVPIEAEVITEPDLASRDLVQMRVTLAVGDEPVTFYNLHLMWQIGWRALRQFDELLNRLDAEAGPTVALGDFNLTNDSPQAALLHDRGYRDAPAITGWGLKTTWPNAGWKRHFILPDIRIDHIFISRQLTSPEVRTISIPGSDHRGILATLALKSQQPSDSAD